MGYVILGLMGVVWVVCGYVAYGRVLQINEELETTAVPLDYIAAAFTALCGPVGLLATLVSEAVTPVPPWLKEALKKKRKRVLNEE